jgi:hypothetical protein
LVHASRVRTGTIRRPASPGCRDVEAVRRLARPLLLARGHAWPRPALPSWWWPSAPAVCTGGAQVPACTAVPAAHFSVEFKSSMLTLRHPRSAMKKKGVCTASVSVGLWPVPGITLLRRGRRGDARHGRRFLLQGLARGIPSRVRGYSRCIWGKNCHFRVATLTNEPAYLTQLTKIHIIRSGESTHSQMMLQSYHAILLSLLHTGILRAHIVITPCAHFDHLET